MQSAARPKVDNGCLAWRALAGSSTAERSVLALPLFLLELMDFKLPSPDVREAIGLESSAEPRLDKGRLRGGFWPCLVDHQKSSHR
jgi:hypothetical protein